jgi:hypothetical protein
VGNQHNLAVIELPMIELPAIEQPVVTSQPAFTMEDILWAVGIWSVIVTMSPVIVFYMLMVA